MGAFGWAMKGVFRFLLRGPGSFSGSDNGSGVLEERMFAVERVEKVVGVERGVVVREIGDAMFDKVVGTVKEFIVSWLCDVYRSDVCYS